MSYKKEIDKQVEENFLVENKFNKSIIQNIIHILCLILPIAFTFLGYFVSDFIWKFILQNQNEATEIFKFGVSICFFCVSGLIVFVTTRNTEHIINIRVS